MPDINDTAAQQFLLQKLTGDRYRWHPDFGVSALCTRCGELLPADTEFFHWNGDRPHSWCKACFLSSDCRKRAEAKHAARCRAAKTERSAARARQRAAKH